MADVESKLSDWSVTASANKPLDPTAVGSGLGDNLRTVQSVVRSYLAHYNSTPIVAAGTTDLGASNGLEQIVSHAGGVVAITSFGVTGAGIWKLVTFSIAGGSLSITYNAGSMILPGVVGVTALTLQNGDHILAYSKGGGNWVIPAVFMADGTARTFIAQLVSKAIPAIADVMAVYDPALAANRQITLADMLKVVGGLTAAAVVNSSSDQFLTYNNNAGNSRRATLAQYAASSTTIGTSRFATSAEAAAGSSSIIGLTPASLGALVSGAGSKMTVKLPGGVIINAGVTNCSAAGFVHETYLTPFTSFVYGYAGSANINPPQGISVQFSSLGINDFFIAATNPSYIAGSAGWIAIGI